MKKKFQSSSHADQGSGRFLVSDGKVDRTDEDPLDDDPRVVVGLERFLDLILRQRTARFVGGAGESD